MESIDEISKQLQRQDTQQYILHKLLQQASSGTDVSASAERVVRYCLYSSSGTTPQILSLALDVLTASPSHAFWVDALSVIIENLKRSGTSACLTCVSKIPSLPHSALQHLVLYATSPLIEAGLNDPSPGIRRAAAQAIAAVTLRGKPLTAQSTEAIRLEQLTEQQAKVIRGNVERLLYTLLRMVFDHAEEVAVSSLALLTSFSLDADASRESSLLNATREATAASIWDILLPSCKKVAERFAPLFSKLARERQAEIQSQASSSPGPKPTSRTGLRARKEGLKGMARLAARALSAKYATLDPTSELQQKLTQMSPGLEYKEAAKKWAVSWVDGVLAPLCDDSRPEISASACSSMLIVCSYAGQNPTPEKVAHWGIKAVQRISRLLFEQDGKMPVVVSTGLIQDATHGLAALSKNDYVTSKFVVAISVGLIPFATKCPSRDVRLEAMSVIASTIVEYDLSGRDVGVGNSMKAVLASDSWKSAIASSKNDSNVAAELVCCFSQSLLDSSRKIFACQDLNLRESLTQTWAVMLAYFMSRTHACLRWQHSPAASYAKELYLKVFDALGQYSSYLMTTQGVGMEEYERLQEALVKETLEQDDVAVRASLLICVTNYWLTGGMKAEANAGHVLKAIWKHAQEHYRDEEVMLNELKTGALWSDARKGAPRQIGANSPTGEGGYVSMTTMLSRTTRAVIDTVGSTVTTAIETSLFGSIALSTAAAEGSTLTTDFAYSSLWAILALVGHNPPLAERAVKILKKYISIMEEAESSDFIVLEAVRNTIAAIEMYLDEFFPKPVAARELAGLSYTSAAYKQQHTDAVAWMNDITESCVFASSRLEDPTKEASTVATEEAILRTAASIKKRIRGFQISTLQNADPSAQQLLEGDHQTLNGASDPFSVVASHSMDTVKGLALIRIEVINRSAFKATNAALTYASSGALMPLPDAATSFSLGSMDHGMSVTQRITLQVRTDQGYAGRVFFSIHTWRDSAGAGVGEEQPCIPYYIPSSDVLLLRKPAPNAGVDVFRRRWDLMRHSISFHVVMQRDQSVDSFVDTLERRSKCLRQVGRMRTYSHVCALVADSSRGDYVAVAALAPEARGKTGEGPCMIYVTIRSNSEGYNRAFREECREWLTPVYRVLFLDEDLSEKDKALALKPQDAYFITDSPDSLSPYQRWRVAHSVRVKH